MGARVLTSGIWYDNGMTFIFLTIGIVATVLLLIAFALDGLFDWLDFDFLDGVVGPTTIFAFISVFGYSGALFTANTGFGLMLVVILSAGVGLLGSAVVGFVMKYLKNSESGFVDDENVVGKSGSVILSIPENGYGKVMVNISGHILEMAAMADKPIQRGSQVVIESAQGSGTVFVRLHEPSSTTA